MAIQLITSLQYESVFDDFTYVDELDLIRNLPTFQTIQIMASISAKLYMKIGSFEFQNEVYGFFFDKLPTDVVLKTKNYTSFYYQTYKTQINIVNDIYILDFIQHLIKNKNDLYQAEEFTSEQKLNLFKAYLYRCQVVTDKIKVDDFHDGLTDYEVAIKLLPVYLPHFEVLSTKNIFIQLSKAIIFFSFCEENQYFKLYLDKFLEYRKINNWKEYLELIVRLYVDVYDPQTEQANSNLELSPDKHSKILNFLDSFILDPENFVSSDDFLGLRDKPVLKISTNKYCFLNINFFIDKIFQGIQFDFGKILVSHQLQYRNRVIKNYVDFKQRVYSAEFSESQLFYTVMQQCINGKSVDYQSNGEAMKLLLKQGEPDFYFRDKAKLFFIEFKDVLFPASQRQSYDFSQINGVIQDKLVVDNGSAKGVTQIVNVINRFLAETYNSFDFYKGPKMIFPILVVTDRSFNSIGVNFLLNIEFIKQLEVLKIDKKKHKIKDLTVINLDTFIQYHTFFFNGSLKLHQCILGYLQYIKNSKNAVNRLSSFDDYMKTIVQDKFNLSFLEEPVRKIMSIIKPSNSTIE